MSERGKGGTENGDRGRRGSPLYLSKIDMVCVFACRVWREIFDKKVDCFPFRHPLETSNKTHYYKYVEWEWNTTSTSQGKVVATPAQF